MAGCTVCMFILKNSPDVKIKTPCPVRNGWHLQDGTCSDQVDPETSNTQYPESSIL